ncbi:hypothetical protein EES45_05505 [Streptomyces sp. ADI97-07]|nr:hypothetical protein EES45_05505 [Streptomyces sp. ADI97-07]
MATYPGAAGVAPVLLAAFAAMMPTPGAVMSGFSEPSAVGPVLENSAIRSLRSTAPTVSAEAALPGEPIVEAPGPSLPAAITKSMPLLADMRSTAASSGSFSAVSSPPRERLATRAPLSAAHCIPAMMPESSPVPSSFRTLTSMIFAPGATPLCLPDFTPEPATVDATWVP